MSGWLSFPFSGSTSFPSQVVCWISYFSDALFLCNRKTRDSTKQKFFETLDGENRYDKTQYISYIPYAPWDWNIYLHEWLKCMQQMQVNIRYTEHLGEVGNPTQWAYLMIKPPVI